MSYIKTIFSKNLRKLRTELSLTQEEFAEKTSTQVRNLTDLENGKYLPTPANIDKICLKLNIPASVLFQTPLEMINDKKSEKIRIISEKLTTLKLEQIDIIHNIVMHAFNK